jgi:hypothetical protein
VKKREKREKREKEIWANGSPDNNRLVRAIVPHVSVRCISCGKYVCTIKEVNKTKKTVYKKHSTKKGKKLEGPVEQGRITEFQV